MTSRYKMGSCCVVVGCTMRSRTNLLSKIKMVTFPAEPARRRLWELAVNRKDWNATNASRICSRHFITGRPSRDPLHPDYVPSVFDHTTPKQVILSVRRYVNSIKRIETKNSNFKTYENQKENHRRAKLEVIQVEPPKPETDKKPVIISFSGANGTVYYDSEYAAENTDNFSESEVTEDEETQPEDADESFGEFVVGLLKTIPESMEKDSLRMRFMEDIMKYKISLLDQN